MRPWGAPVPLHEAARGPVTVELAPDAETRAGVARELGLESLPALTAEVTVSPWFDGVRLEGRVHAVVEQICGVTLDPFEQPLEATFDLTAVPAGSPHAPAPPTGEVELDPDAADPPDVLERPEVDVAAYVIEHLALEIDPFPRKPGAVFEPEPEDKPESPFAVLKRLKGDEA